MDETTIAKIDLATVAKTVAETDRRRVLVEEKLSQAASVVEALNAESKSLQESVLELKRDLEATAKAKDQETAALGRTLEERKRALDEVKSLAAAADELRAASERTSATIGANLDGARQELTTLQSSVIKSSSDAKALDDMVNQLCASVAEARRQADGLESQLAGVSGTTKSAVVAAADIQLRIDEARTALDAAAGRKRETDETCAALGAITTALRSRTTDAVLAAASIDDLMAEQARQSSALTNRLAAVAKLVGTPERANGSASVAASNGSLAEAPRGTRFDDALRAIGLLSLERLITPEEAQRISSALHAGDGERALREAWVMTSGAPMPPAHRLIFGEVLRAMGDVKAAIIYYEQAASARNAAPVVRYLVSLAYLGLELLDRSTHVSQLLARDRGGKLLGKVVEALRAEQTGNADYAAHVLADATILRGFPKWEYDEAYFQLGGLHERRNDSEAAVSAYENVNGSSAPYADVVDRVRGLF